MKKFLIFVLFSCMSLGIARSYAQSVDSLLVVVDNLREKVVRLEKDAAYQKICTDLNRLNAEVEILSLQVRNVLVDLRVAVLCNNIAEEKSRLQKKYKWYQEKKGFVNASMNLLQMTISLEKDSLFPLAEADVSSKLSIVLTSYKELEGLMSVMDNFFKE